MARRYLTLTEAKSALERGKSIEAFLGNCRSLNEAGIRWVQIRPHSLGAELHIYESADLGSENYLDVYEFGPLDPNQEQDEAKEVLVFPSLEVCLSSLDQRWPNSSARLVNEFVVQDEYLDYVRSGRDA